MKIKTRISNSVLYQSQTPEQRVTKFCISRHHENIYRNLAPSLIQWAPLADPFYPSLLTLPSLSPSLTTLLNQVFLPRAI